MLIKVIVVGLHPPMNPTYPLGRISDFDIATHLRRQARGLREVGVE